MLFASGLKSRRTYANRVPIRQALGPALELLEDRLTPTVQPVSFADPTLIAATGGDDSRLGNIVGNSVAGATVSADGRYIAFVSAAPNLAPGQQMETNANTTDDVFLYDRQLGTIALVSHSAAGINVVGDASSSQPVISADGSYVAFASDAGNLVAGQVDPNLFSSDVFLYEVATGTVTMLDHAFGTPATTGNGGGFGPAISADGRYVAFASGASNIIAGQIGAGGVFLFDRVAGTTVLVSHTPAAGNTTGAGGGFCAISADGKQVAFLSSATNLVPSQIDTNGQEDVFIYDTTTQVVTLVSHTASSSITTANGTNLRMAMSNDDGTGNYHVVFSNTGTNLVSGQSDANGSADTFLWSKATGVVSLVSHTPAAGFATTGNTGSGSSSLGISQNGQFVVFAGSAGNLVTGEVDSNGSSSEDIYLYTRATGVITLVSHIPTSLVTTGNFSADFASISADGSYVAFQSIATNLITGAIDTNAGRDVFLLTRATGALTLVSHAVGSATTTGNGVSDRPVEICADGAFVAFNSKASNLTAGVLDMNNRIDVFLYDRAASTSATVSLHDPLLPSLTANEDTFSISSVSADGRYVAFDSGATNLAAGQVDSVVTDDVFLLDRTTGTVALVSHVSASPSTTGNGVSQNGLISADGKFVVFSSLARNLLAGQIDPSTSTTDLFLYEVATGIVRMISHKAGAPATAGLSGGASASISDDGTYVTFQSGSTDLVAGQVGANQSIYLYERATGNITLVSHANAAPVTTGNGTSRKPVINANGNWIAYDSAASNLVSGQVDAAGFFDEFLYDRAAGTSVLISHKAGLPAQAGNLTSSIAAISADGAYVVFQSYSTDLVAAQIGTGSSIFLYDRSTGGVTLVSHASTSLTTTGNGDSFTHVLSADGRYVAYDSGARNLVAGQIDNNFDNDVFLYDRVTGINRLVSHAAGSLTTAANQGSALASANYFPEWLSDDGNHLAFLSLATNLVPGQIDANGGNDVFRFERTTDTMLLVSHALGAPTTASIFPSEGGTISGDGSVIVFDSMSTNLVAGDFNNSGDEFVFIAAPVDVTAPTVLGAFFDGTFDSDGAGSSDNVWDPAFRTAAGNASYGFPAQTGGNQLTDMPWSTIDTVRVKFSENVNIVSGNLGVRGINVGSYSVMSFSYDSVNFVATWVMIGNVDTDRIILDLDGASASAVKDPAGNKLAGTWTEGVSTFPTTGAAGVNFQYRFLVGVGDADRNGQIRNGDLNLVRGNLFNDLPSGTFNVFADMNGDGLVRNADLNAVRAHLFNDPPAGPGPFRPVRGRHAAASNFSNDNRLDRRYLNPSVPQAADRARDSLLKRIPQRHFGQGRTVALDAALLANLTVF